MIFGVGTDIVEVARIEAALTEFGEAFARRILAENELVAYEASQIKPRFLAKRFAAKEAFSKALGTGIRGVVTFQSIQVTHDAMGKPLLAFNQEIETLLAEKQIRTAHVSISDEKNLAVAFVVLES
ncbi:MAG TPA: holo-ACP synthase [Methylophilus sp.]|nr:holo-ACP synthase [Methylophilus sp.]HQQ33555.1 holo-ACP synthase [Methylophilus sp.]